MYGSFAFHYVANAFGDETNAEMYVVNNGLGSGASKGADINSLNYYKVSESLASAHLSSYFWKIEENSFTLK